MLIRITTNTLSRYGCSHRSTEQMCILCASHLLQFLNFMWKQSTVSLKLGRRLVPWQCLPNFSKLDFHKNNTTCRIFSQVVTYVTCSDKSDHLGFSSIQYGWIPLSVYNNIKLVEVSRDNVDNRPSYPHTHTHKLYLYLNVTLEAQYNVSLFLAADWTQGCSCE